MKQSGEKKIYLYGRLSKEDAKVGDSLSIENQQKILTAYAEENGFTNYEFVFDDDYSGADWSRPAFCKMVREVREGRVSTVAVKDLSRFGRDYLECGMYMERVFPEYDVRFIAVHDNVDTALGDNDMAPMINYFNEWFLKSTSKKIRAVLQDKGKRGERLAVIPIYGYRKPDDGSKGLVVDEESAEVVRRIFKMCTEGISAAAIAGRLMSERLLNPSAYKYEKGIMTKLRPMKDPYLWNATTIHKILDAPEYLGHTINFKTWSKSYKDNRPRLNPAEKQLVFQGTHPAIIDEHTWAVVRKMRRTKRRAPRYGEVGLFTGLVFCSDCGAKLYYHTRELKTKSAVRHDGAYSCSNYRKAVQFKSGRKCTCHYISEASLSGIVLDSMRNLLCFASEHEMEFARLVMETGENEQKRDIAAKKLSLAQKRAREDELDALLDRIYEDHVAGKLSDERHARMTEKYEQEQKEIRAEIPKLEIAMSGSEAKLGDLDKFIGIVRKYTDIKELTPVITNEFIDRIVIHEPEKARGNRIQKIEIIYNGIGAVEAPQAVSMAATS